MLRAPKSSNRPGSRIEDRLEKVKEAGWEASQCHIAWDEANSGMLCSIRNDENSNSERVTSVDLSALANDNTDGWNFAADAAFKMLLCSAGLSNIITAAVRDIDVDIITAEIAESIVKLWLSYTMKVVMVLNFKLLFVLARFLAFCKVTVSHNSVSAAISFTSTV